MYLFFFNNSLLLNQNFPTDIKKYEALSILNFFKILSMKGSFVIKGLVVYNDHVLEKSRLTLDLKGGWISVEGQLPQSANDQLNKRVMKLFLEEIERIDHDKVNRKWIVLHCKDGRTLKFTFPSLELFDQILNGLSSITLKRQTCPLITNSFKTIKKTVNQTLDGNYSKSTKLEQSILRSKERLEKGEKIDKEKQRPESVNQRKSGLISYRMESIRKRNLSNSQERQINHLKLNNNLDSASKFLNISEITNSITQKHNSDSESSQIISYNPQYETNDFNSQYSQNLQSSFLRSISRSKASRPPSQLREGRWVKSSKNEDSNFSSLTPFKSQVASLQTPLNQRDKISFRNAFKTLFINNTPNEKEFIGEVKQSICYPKKKSNDENQSNSINCNLLFTEKNKENDCEKSYLTIGSSVKKRGESASSRKNQYTKRLKNIKDDPFTIGFNSLKLTNECSYKKDIEKNTPNIEKSNQVLDYLNEKIEQFQQFKIASIVEREGKEENIFQEQINLKIQKTDEEENKEQITLQSEKNNSPVDKQLISSLDNPENSSLANQYQINTTTDTKILSFQPNNIMLPTFKPIEMINKQQIVAKIKQNNESINGDQIINSIKIKSCEITFNKTKTTKTLNERQEQVITNNKENNVKTAEKDHLINQNKQVEIKNKDFSPYIPSLLVNTTKLSPPSNTSNEPQKIQYEQKLEDNSFDIDSIINDYFQEQEDKKLSTYEIKSQTQKINSNLNKIYFTDDNSNFYQKSHNKIDNDEQNIQIKMSNSQYKFNEETKLASQTVQKKQNQQNNTENTFQKIPNKQSTILTDSLKEQSNCVKIELMNSPKQQQSKEKKSAVKRRQRDVFNEEYWNPVQFPKNYQVNPPKTQLPQNQEIKGENMQTLKNDDEQKLNKKQSKSSQLSLSIQTSSFEEISSNIPEQSHIKCKTLHNKLRISLFDEINDNKFWKDCNPTNEKDSYNRNDTTSNENTKNQLQINEKPQLKSNQSIQYEEQNYDEWDVELQLVP